MQLQKPEEKRHLLRWWVDTSGRDLAQLRAAGPLPCFGERLIDAAGGRSNSVQQLRALLACSAGRQ